MLIRIHGIYYGAGSNRGREQVRYGERGEWREGNRTFGADKGTVQADWRKYRVFSEMFTEMFTDLVARH
jgi:hypothetical protein